MNTGPKCGYGPNIELFSLKKDLNNDVLSHSAYQPVAVIRTNMRKFESIPLDRVAASM